MTNTLDSFETALLHRLQEHLDNPPTAPAPPTQRSRHLRPLISAAAVTAAATGALLVVPGIDTSTAYSVQEGNSERITVEVHRLEDANGLEAELAEHGVRADITYVPDGRECAPGRYVPVNQRLSGMTIGLGSNLLRVTLPPGTVRSTETFVLAVSGETVAATDDDAHGSEMFSGWTDADVTAGPVRRCDPVTP